jgi:hypothetical protein
VSQSLLVITDPFASIILSIWLFGERFTNSPAKITIAVLAFTVMATGLTVLTRTAPQDVLIPVTAVVHMRWLPWCLWEQAALTCQLLSRRLIA